MNTVGYDAASWTFQQDYLTFLAVLGWLTAGLMAWGDITEDARGRTLPWKWFAFFCFFNALDATLDLAKMIVPEVWPLEIDASLRLIGYAYLMEFTRRAMATRGWMRLPAWAPPMIVAAAQLVLIYAPRSSPWPEMAIAILAGVSATVVIAASIARGTRLLLVIAAVLPFLAPRELLRAVSGAAVDGLYGLLVTGEGVASALCAAVLAWTAAGGFWLHAVLRRRRGLFAGRPEAFSPVVAIILPAALVGTLALGFYLVNGASQRERERIERNYLERARTAALTVDADMLADIVVSGRINASVQISRRILAQVQAVQSISDDMLRAYLWTVVDGGVLLPGGWMAVQAGTTGEAPIKGVGIEALPAPGRGNIIGPIGASDAPVLIASAPIMDSVRRAHRAWIGLDFSAAEWLLSQALARLQTIALVGLFAILIVFFLAYVMLREREAELLIGKERAEAADRAKDEFLAVMSHEIRTPMQSVLGYSELMARTPLTAAQGGYLDTIQGQGRTLLRIVQDILDFSTLRKTSYTLKNEDVHLHRVIDTAFEGLRPIAARKSIRFECTIANDVPEVVHGDGVRIEQILLNLLNNAVKFTDRGSVQLDVSCEHTEPVGGGTAQWVLFSISDTGMGIRPEDVRKLFQPFTRLTNGDQVPREGTGLGLAIVKRLSQLMGGNVGIESEWGKGTRFFVRIPFSVVVAAASATSADNGAHAAPTPAADPVNLGAVLPLDILVAEDNPFIRRLVIEYLQTIGYEPTAVGTGTEAAERWREFDLIIMDLRMPGLDGITAAERIRAASGLETVPWIIGVSASLAENEIERAMKAGMNDFLGKPFFVPSLVEAIQASPLFERRTGDPEAASADAADDDRTEPPPPMDLGAMSWMPDLSTAENNDIVREATAEIPTVLDEIDQALAGEDLATAADRAHYLKNTVFALRIEPMVAPCRSVFERSQSGDLVSARQSMETLRVAFTTWNAARTNGGQPTPPAA